MIDENEILSDCIKWAKEAGQVQLSFFRSDNLNIQTKFNKSDVVTDADKKSEQIIISHIRKKYPTHSILSEESGESFYEGDYLWVIDPLDGTTNFSCGLPEFSVSIGVQYKGETIVGVVYAPYLNELFHAVRGQGAFLNGKPVRASMKSDIQEAVIATGFPVDKNITNDNNLDNFSKVLPLVRDMRRLGSAAVDISYVACGVLDAYWELNLHEWDVCAGLLIAEEAGAKIDFFRSDRNVSVLVAGPNMMDHVSPLLSRVKAE